MATQLETFPGPSRRGTYDWDTLLDGKPWEAKHGTDEERKTGKVDFSIGAKSFRSAAQQAAKARGGIVNTRILHDGKVVALQFKKDQPAPDAA